MACLYCEKGEKMQGFTYPVCKMSVSTIYLHREQSYLGRCILVLNDHVEEYSELTTEQGIGVHEDLHRLTKAMTDIFHPGKINIGAFGDTVRHFHLHVVPKTEGGLDWNGLFQMNPNQTHPTDEALEEIALSYRKALKLE